MASILSTTPDASVQAQQGAATAGMQQAGQAYSNYRQFDRDNYANQLSNQSSLYQGLLNRMAAAGDSAYSPNTAQMSNNPMSFQQTMVGATHGSNAAGNGVGFGAGAGSNVDGNGNIKPGAYGLIGATGSMGAPGQWQAPGAMYAPTLAANGQPRPSAPTGGGTPSGGINTNNTRPLPPTGYAQSAPPQFSFAPSKP